MKKVCPHCGKENFADSTFTYCTFCGGELIGLGPDMSGPAAAQQGAQLRKASPGSGSAATSLHQVSGGNGGGKRRGPSPLLLIALGLLCVGLVVAGIFLLRGREAGGPDTPTPPVTPVWEEPPSDKQNFFLPVSEDDVVEENGVQYASGQLVVISAIGVTYDEMEALFSSYGLEIVGYIELMDTYQVQLKEARPLEELDQLAEDLSADGRVETASVDVVWEVDAQAMPSDPWSTDRSDSADWSAVSGSNWGVKAINAPYYWENFDQGEVKVGVIDSMFYPYHEDLVAQFALCRYNEIFDTYVPNGSDDASRDHGTHVSGIIGATHDNQVGLSGVLEDSRIYAYASWGFDGSMNALSAIAELSQMGARVINYSIGYTDTIIFAAVSGDTFAQKYYYEDAANFSQAALQRLIDKGSDFLFVVSAGNSSTDAIWGSEFSYITAPQVKARILVVGAAEMRDGGYAIAPFSNYGPRLDVMAPGVGIFSSLPYDSYASWDGTSMAAPHVTGACAAIWAASPGLTGSQVRDIAVATADIYVEGGCPGMIDMKAAMDSVAPPKASADERDAVLQIYAALLRQGITLNENTAGLIPVQATHYALFEMDGDGIEEMIVFGSPAPGEWAFRIYSCRNGNCYVLVDSASFVDPSSWTGSHIHINSSEGILHLLAERAGASDGSYERYIVYDGSLIRSHDSAAGLPQTGVSGDCLFVDGSDIYAIRIGSQDDLLSGIVAGADAPEPPTALSITGWGPWSLWTRDPVAHDELCEGKTREVYHYFFYVCSNCGAHMYEPGECLVSEGGCGQQTVPSSSLLTWRWVLPYQQTDRLAGTDVCFKTDRIFGRLYAYPDPANGHYVAPWTEYSYRSPIYSTDPFNAWTFNTEVNPSILSIYGIGPMIYEAPDPIMGATGDCYPWFDEFMQVQIDSSSSYSYSGEWSVEICEGITTIGEGAFLDWSYLREVHIPKSVTLIYENAFWFAAITDIYYAGSAEDWAKIQIIPCGDSANCTLNTATMHFNAD